MVGLGHVGLGQGLLLGLRVLVEGTEELDLLSLSAGRGRLGGGLEQMQSLAVFSGAMKYRINMMKSISTY